MEISNNHLKERHGCVSAWLIFMIIANCITLGINIFAPDLIAKSLHYPSTLIMMLYSIVALINILCSVMILKWKKWGFLGFIVTGLIGASLNFYIGSGIFASLIGLIGIPFLFGILQIKKNNVAAWDNLE